MSDQTGAGIGFICAGLSAAVALETWPPGAFNNVAVAATMIATAAFFLRRRDLVARRVGTPVAALAALSALGTALAALGATSQTLAELGGPLLGPVIVSLGAIGAIAGAWIDWVDLTASRVLALAQRAGVGAGIGLLGIASIVFWGILLAMLLGAGGTETLSPIARVTLSTIALGLGTASVAAAVLLQSEKSWNYVDARIPDRRGWIYVVLGTATLLGANIGIEFLFSIAGVETTTHSLVRAARETPQILLALVPLSYLVVGPGEELLYRNVVQKYLDAEFSTPAAIVVASVIFASVHLPAYADPTGSVLALVNTLTVVFALSVVLGVAYARTGNVVVSALVHGSFNAIAFALTYVELTDVVGAVTDGCLTSF